MWIFMWMLNYFPPYYLFSHNQNIVCLSLLYHHFQVHSLSIPQFRHLQLILTMLHTQGRIILIPLVRKKFYLGSFLPRTVTFCNSLLRGCYPVHNNLNRFKSWINDYLLSTTSFSKLSILSDSWALY